MSMVLLVLILLTLLFCSHYFKMSELVGISLPFVYSIHFLLGPNGSADYSLMVYVVLLLPILLVKREKILNSKINKVYVPAFIILLVLLGLVFQSQGESVILFMTPAKVGEYNNDELSYVYITVITLILFFIIGRKRRST